MKRKVLFMILAFLVFLFACSPKANKEADLRSKDIEFEIVKSQLAKSFQRTDPFAEFKNKDFDPVEDDTIAIMISLGLTESSGFSIDKVIKDKNNLNIHVTSEFNDDKLKLAVPQAVIRVDSKHIKDDIDSLNLNIINEDYKPINLKFSLNDAVSKVDSEFKLSSNTVPEVDLLKKDGEFIWDIKYNCIIDQENKDMPLIKFHTLINANTGDVLHNNKTLISNPLDFGTILNFEDDYFLTYKKSILDKKTNDLKEELWTYNIKNEELNNVFLSDDNIISTQISPNNEQISFIECSDEGSNLFLIPKDSKNAFKIHLKNDINPDIINWIDDENICVVEKSNGNSNLYKYNINNNILSEYKELPVDMHSLLFFNDKLLFTENQGDLINKKIHILEANDIKIIGEGFQPRFITDNIIVYLKDMESTDSHMLYFYDLTKDKIIHKLSDNIQHFQIIDDYKLIYISKQKNHNNFNIYKYDLKEDELNLIETSISNKAHYSISKNKLYLNINSPIEEDTNQIIYPIDLNND